MQFRFTRWRLGLAVLLTACVCASVAWYARRQEKQYRNLVTVQPGVLYRAGQMTPTGFERVIYEYNIGTVINLRGGNSDKQQNSAEWEEKLCFLNYSRFISIPLGSSELREQLSPGDAQQAIDQAVKQFLEIMADPITYPQPVLIHCTAGIHRTGVMSALYRMERQGWSKDQALAEMKALGYSDFVSYDPLRDYVLNWKHSQQVRSQPTR